MTLDYLAALGVARRLLSLGQAQAEVAARLADGHRCPCCGQFAKVYRRQINGEMSRALIAMYQNAGIDWLHLPTAVPQGGGDRSKLVYWELIEEAKTPPRPDTSSRTGWARVTDKGAAFLRGNLAVDKYALVYDGRLLGFEGPQVTIRDTVGKRFNYEELMAA